MNYSAGFSRKLHYPSNFSSSRVTGAALLVQRRAFGVQKAEKSGLPVPKVLAVRSMELVLQAFAPAREL
jgi:hypothetical protein